MPPKVSGGRRGKQGSSVTVGSTHPANVAAARKKANVATSKTAPAPTRESPKRSAKTVANDRIAAQLSPHDGVPVASVAPHGAEINATVVAPFSGGAAESFTVVCWV